MKTGIYDPYLDILGGGEKYILTIARLFSEVGQVDIFWSKDLKKKAELITGYNLQNINFVGKFLSGKVTKDYDFFFYVTDGSLFFSRAKKSYLIIQVPQENMYSQDLLTRLKLTTWTGQLCYSSYVKGFIEKWWRKTTFVLPPAIQTTDFRPDKKERIILSVGRFFPLPHSKKQEVMISAFQKMIDQGLANWRLILIGGVDEQAKDYLAGIKKLIGKYPIEIYTNVDFVELKKYYSRATFYWHAAGYGEDLNVHPERAEHFGMTTLEAMSSGCIPLVYPAGGQKEIVQDEENGFYWITTEDLVHKTWNLISNPGLWKKYSKSGQLTSKDYSLENFKINLAKITDVKF